MKPKLLFTLAAIYMVLGGLNYLILPATAMFGLDSGASPLLIAGIRETASTFIGIAVLNWFARNTDASKARNAIFLANIVGFALATIFGVLVALASAQIVAWVFVVINLFFTIAFLLVGRPNMALVAN